MQRSDGTHRNDRSSGDSLRRRISLTGRVVRQSRSSSLLCSSTRVLALLENGKLEPATDALRLAVRLDPTQPESHYNFGLIYERRDMLFEAEQEMLVAPRLEPEQLDARNMGRRSLLPVDLQQRLRERKGSRATA
jgi:Flp pilus assembly protein TadD